MNPGVCIIRVSCGLFVLCLLTGISHLGASSIDGLSFEDPALEHRYRTLLDDFRCPVCQNTSLAGSDAPVARDLRRQVYRMLARGHSDAEIRDWISERYGDFVLYAPPVRGLMLTLWAAPVLLFTAACVLLWRRLGRTPSRTNA